MRKTSAQLCERSMDAYTVPEEHFVFDAIGPIRDLTAHVGRCIESQMAPE